MLKWGCRIRLAGQRRQAGSTFHVKHAEQEMVNLRKTPRTPKAPGPPTSTHFGTISASSALHIVCRSVRNDHQASGWFEEFAVGSLPEKISVWVAESTWGWSRATLTQDIDSILQSPLVAAYHGAHGKRSSSGCICVRGQQWRPGIIAIAVQGSSGSVLTVVVRCVPSLLIIVAVRVDGGIPVVTEDPL